MTPRLRHLGVAALLAAGACTQTFDATSLGVPATMAAAPGISQANLRKALSRQLVGGQGISNLKIKTKSRWLDVLVTGITLGLIVPRTVIYEGTITGR